MYKPKNFGLKELVCPEVYNKYGETAWEFFDPHLLETLDRLRVALHKKIIINNWSAGGKFTQRGLRCNLCELVETKTKSKKIYMSSHILGKAVDFNVDGMTAEEVRKWIITHQNEIPYPICLEADVSWVHLDMRDKGRQVYVFKA